MIRDAPHHLAHGNVIRMRGVLGHEADVASNAPDTDGGGKIADLERTLFPFFPSCARDESNSALHGRYVGVTLAGVGCKDGDNRERVAFHGGLPTGCHAVVELHVARYPQLP